MVNTLDDLCKLVLCKGGTEEKHLLYPFIGSWDPRLIEVAGEDFELLREFKDIIIMNLKEWVTLEHEDKADYYLRLFDFKNKYEHPLRIFTLNYDLCVCKVYPFVKTKILRF